MLRESTNNETPLPKGIFVEVTNHCNFRCSFCPSSFSKRPKGFMDFAIFKKIVDEAKEGGVEYLNLWLLGEPALHPQILDFMAYAHNKGLWAAFITNGSLFFKKQDLFKKLISDFEKIVFNVSYYGEGNQNAADCLTYDKGLRWFIEENIISKKSHHVNILVIINTKNDSYQDMAVPGRLSSLSDKLNLYFKNIKIKFNIKNGVHLADSKKALQALKNNFYKVEIIPNITIEIAPAHNWAKTFLPEYIKTLPKKHGYCSLPWHSLAISWNGDCTFCCVDYEISNNIGNVTNKSLQDIWNSDRVKEIRKALNKNKLILPYCQKCKSILMPQRINLDSINYILKYYKNPR